MRVRCINNKPLQGNDVAPPLEVGKEYDLISTVSDKQNNPHYDVGLVSKFNYVTSRDTGEKLPNSSFGGIHWCHPSRFEIVEA